MSLEAEVGHSIREQLMDQLANIAKAIGEVFRRVWDWWQKMYPTTPRETVRLIPRSRRHRWQAGSVGGNPAMQLVSSWHATNITTEPVYLLGVQLKHPRTEGGVFVQHPEENIFGEYPILPGATAEVTANFWVQPPVREPGQDFETAVIFIDHYGNAHKVKHVVFQGPGTQGTQDRIPTGSGIGD